MVVCSKEEFQVFVERFPNLCGSGMVSRDYCHFFKIDFIASRNQLIEAYEDFIACCDWLSGCRFDDYATHFSPGSERLLERVRQTLNRSIHHGSLIAAVLYLELPHVTPGVSPGLSVGVSLFCPRLQAAAS